MEKDKLHIIFCDDDEDDRDLFELVVRQWASKVKLRLVGSADELIKELKAASVDLVFLDLNMPVVSGRECLKMIRANKEFDAAAVIIYSTAANDADLEALSNMPQIVCLPR